MIKLVKSKEKFFDKDVYLVNCAKDCGIITIEPCPYCKEKHAYKVYDPKIEWESNRYTIAIYDCKCPSCNREFEIMDEFDNLED